MAGTRANNEMSVWQLTLQLLGRRQGSSRVVVTPHQLDRTPHRSDRRSVISASVRTRMSRMTPERHGSHRTVALS